MSEATGRIELRIAGMHCASCAMAIDLGLEGLLGVVDSRTNFARATTVVRYDPARVEPGVLLGAIRDLGYEAEPGTGDAASDPAGTEPRGAWHLAGFFRRGSRA
jgi:P-type Cu+ transporter